MCPKWWNWDLILATQLGMDVRIPLPHPLRGAEFPLPPRCVYQVSRACTELASVHCLSICPGLAQSSFLKGWLMSALQDAPTVWASHSRAGMRVTGKESAHPFRESRFWFLCSRNGIGAISAIYMVSRETSWARENL